MAKILVLFDVPFWAQHRHSEGLRKYAPAGYEVQTCQIGHESESMYRAADAVYCIYLASARKGPGVRRLASCVASHAWMWPTYIPEDWRTRGVNKDRNCNRGRMHIRPLDACICRNSMLTEWARQFNGTARTIPAGVDIEIFSPGDFRKPNKLKVGWCGQIAGEPRKDFKGYNELLVPLMERLGDRYEWSANTRIYTGALSQQEMADWYRSLDVFICCPPVDGTPNPIFEAVSSGIPAISTHVGQVVDWKALGDADMRVPTYYNPETAEITIQAFMERLERLEDHSYREQIREQLTTSIRTDYTYEKLAPITLAFVAGEN